MIYHFVNFFYHFSILVFCFPIIVVVTFIFFKQFDFVYDFRIQFIVSLIREKTKKGKQFAKFAILHYSRINFPKKKLKSKFIPAIQARERYRERESGGGALFNIDSTVSIAVEHVLLAGVIDRIPVNSDRLNVNSAFGQQHVAFVGAVASVDHVPLQCDSIPLSCDLFRFASVC